MISAHMVNVPVFTPEETHSLLTEPMKFSSLWEKDAANRPRFAAEFWGENGIQRIHETAGGWPYFVQLLAQILVDLANDTGANSIDNALFEKAVERAVESAHSTYHEILRKECDTEAEWTYLKRFRNAEVLPPPNDEDVYAALRRRQLVIEENGMWRLRVPLMRRWLVEKGY